jgi:drug/metabolite transporter (DMT)-like permease
MSRAIWSMLGAILAFSTVDALMKFLAGNYPVMQLVFLKSVFQLLPVLATVIRAGGWAPLRMRRPGFVLARAATILFATILWFLGLRLLPLVDAFAIHFTAPILVVVLSRLILKEAMPGRSVLALSLGFIGALAITIETTMGPSDHRSPLGFLFIALSVLFYAASLLCIRRMGPDDAGMPSLFYASIVAVVGSGVTLPWIWTPMALQDWGLIFVTGLLAALGGLGLGAAFSRAPASVVAPLEYTGMVWAILFGYLFFSERPDVIVLVGAGFILAGSWMVSRRQ